MAIFMVSAFGVVRAVGPRQLVDQDSQVFCDLSEALLVGRAAAADRIRDIIFGTQMRDYEQQFRTIQRDLDRLQGEVDRLNERLAEEASSRGKDIRDLRQEMRALGGEMRQEMRAQRAEMRQEMLELRRAIKAGAISVSSSAIVGFAALLATQL